MSQLFVVFFAHLFAEKVPRLPIYLRKQAKSQEESALPSWSGCSYGVPQLPSYLTLVDPMCQKKNRQEYIMSGLVAAIWIG